MNNITVWLVVLCIVGICYGGELATKLNINKEIQSVYPCVTLADKKGFIGCRSSRNGDYGPLNWLSTKEEIDDFLANKPSWNQIVILNSTLFVKDNVDKLIETKKVSGFLVAPGTAPPEGFSPAEKYPQKQFGLHPDSDYQWNPLGNDWSYNYYNTPMFLLREDDDHSDLILKRAAENKAKKDKYPLWGANLHAFMHASVNSETCLRRGQCQNLGSKSVWSTFGLEVNTAKDIILVQATMDSNAFFHDVALGADADISGVVTLLLAIDALKELYNATGGESWSKQLIFAFWTGESWGYLGSKKFVDDILHFECKKVDKLNGNCDQPYRGSLEFQKVKMDKISSIIELNQVGKLTNGNVYVHSEHNTNVNDLITLFQSESQEANITIQAASSNTPGVPPSSLMSFLLEKDSLKGVVLAEHNEQYTNKYYQSRFDNLDNVDPDDVWRVSTMLANVLYKLANDGQSPSNHIITNRSLANELMYCFTKNMSCEKVKEYEFNLRYDPQPTQYVSVFSRTVLHGLTPKFIYDYVFDMTGENLNFNCTSTRECRKQFDGTVNGTECVKQTCVVSGTYFHDAISTGVDAGVSGFSPTSLWKSEATWTESDWAGTYIEIFLMENPTNEIAVLVIGIIEFVASFIGVWYLQKFLSARIKST